jgi:hypothetical protein
MRAKLRFGWICLVAGAAGAGCSPGPSPRDEYGFVDAGALLVGFRSGVGIRTSHGAVSFRP